MKKFLVLICTVAMVAGLATNAFAVGSIYDPFDQPDWSSSSSSGPAIRPAGGSGSGSSGGGAATTTSGGGSTSSSTSSSSTSAAAASTSTSTSTGTAATTDTKKDSADIANYEKDSLAKILVKMLNYPEEVYTTADVVAAMKIDGDDEKTIDGTAVDTSALVIISKALDSECKGANFEKTDAGFDVTLTGNELTKDREADELIIIAAPKDPDAEKALLADVELTDAGELKFAITEDCAICITLAQ